MPQGPRILVPPPLVFILAYVLGLALDRLVPLHPTARFGLLGALASVVMAAGIGLTLMGLLTLLRARTGIMPMRPVKTLVVTGPYRFSRNPIYLGLAVLYIGLAVQQRHAWALVTLPLGLWALRKLVIDVEEAHLAGRFGEEYEAYRRAVRRWI